MNLYIFFEVWIDYEVLVVDDVGGFDFERFFVNCEVLEIFVLNLLFFGCCKRFGYLSWIIKWCFIVDLIEN